MNFIEEEESNLQMMSSSTARNKFPSFSSTSAAPPIEPPAAAAAADLSLGLSSSSEETLLEKEHMFDKVVTPSDVGKLNRLVIPKQHAERYFPLDSTGNEKGLLLNFEDPNGKPWRFRYSYWNSSQSYVMTKGWSRFVKDKKLDAGDVVSFHRGLGQGKDRLFIDCRKRLEPVASDHHNRRAAGRMSPLLDGRYFSFDNYRSYPYHQQQQWSYKTSGPSRDHGGVYWQNNIYHQHHHHQYHQPRRGYGGSSCNNNNNNPGGSGPYGRIDPVPTNFSTTMVPSEPAVFSNPHLMCLRSPSSSGVQTTAMHEPVYESVPIVVKGIKAEKKKRLRLFGVNMEESSEELRLATSSSSSRNFVNKGKSSSFDLGI